MEALEEETDKEASEVSETLSEASKGKLIDEEVDRAQLEMEGATEALAAQ